MRRDSVVKEGDQKNCGRRRITETTHPSGKNPRWKSLKAEEREEREKKKQESKK